jgi:hypothetical protein
VAPRKSPPPYRFPAAGSSSRSPRLNPGMHNPGWQLGKLT